MANAVYNRGKYLIFTNAIGVASDLRVLLVKSSYTFDATHNVVTDVSADEISAAGYARAPLSNEAITEDDGNGFAYLDADDTVMGSIATGQTIGGAILYKYNASDASADLVAFYDMTDTPTNGAAITVQWAAPASGGVLKLS